MNSSRRDLLKLSPLALAGLAPTFAQTAPPGRGGVTVTPMFFDVRRFGATGSGTSLDTPAVNAAIDAAAKAGGGTVYFPAGTYLAFRSVCKARWSSILRRDA